MSRLTLTGPRPGGRTHRLAALLAIALLCLAVATVFAGPAFAEGDDTGTVITSGGASIRTAEGLEAPVLDYSFVWWTFILTFGLLIAYYIVILRVSEKEFKKIVDAHFGPKQDGS